MWPTTSSSTDSVWATGVRKVATATVTVLLVALPLAAQAPPDQPFAGSKLTRTDLLAKLIGPDPGTTPSVADGKALFQKTCAACHVLGESGGSIGPDLTTLASRFSKRDMLRSILWPSETISDQYTVTMVALTDGTYESGLIFREDATNLYIKNADHADRPLAIPLARIKSRDVSTVSLMPEGLLADYSLQQIDSLLAFLLTAK